MQLYLDASQLSQFDWHASVIKHRQKYSKQVKLINKVVLGWNGENLNLNCYYIDYSGLTRGSFGLTELID
jgi:hypothetical protein